jgi:hypothetical protein
MDSELICELRRLFLDGATPSRLMRLIADRAGDSDRLHFTISDYFEEAFGVPLVRYVDSDENYSPDPRHAHFNRDLFPEIIEHLGDWEAQPPAGSWLERAEVNSRNEHREQLMARLGATGPEELARVWGTLNDKERRAVVLLMAKSDRSWQVIKALSLLAERLQQKVVELEARVIEAPPAGDRPAQAETAGS